MKRLSDFSYQSSEIKKKRWMIHFDPPLQGDTLQDGYSNFPYRFLVLLIFIAFSLFAHPVLAADLTVTCSDSCTKSTNDPLFSSSTIWYPGLSQEKSVHITNTRTKSLSLSTSASNTTNTDNLGDVMMLNIKRIGGETFWNGSLTAFYASAPIALLTIPENNGTADLMYTITMDLGANNDYQNKTTVFDLNFTFQGDDETSPSNPSSTDGGGGGTGAGGTTTTTTTTTTVSPLTQVISFLPRFFIPTGPAVAGVQTTEPPEPEKIEEGEVSGTATCQVCFWWPLLLIQALLTILLYMRGKQRNNTKFWKVGAFVAALTYAVFLYLNSSCRIGWHLWISTDNFWCKYFIVWVVLIFGILSRLMRPKGNDVVGASNSSNVSDALDDSTEK